MSARDDVAGHPFAAQARRWAERAGADAAQCELAARLAQRVIVALDEGHSCIRLEPAEHRAALGCGIVGSAGQAASHPLVVDRSGRLYLHRQFDHERRLAARLAALCLDDGGDSAPAHAEAAADPRRQAVLRARRQRFMLISGGPGTGKTSTVVQLLAALLEAQPGLRIVLAAPTGKAAGRLQEAIRERAHELPPALRAALPERASTVHRLLGQDRQGRPRHHAGQPLTLDVLVVDEASMLDVALAASLCDALPQRARLILLGDRDQLAAVESGAVFAELAGLPAGHRLGAHVVHFEQQFRFAAGSALAHLAAAVRDGDAAAAQAVLAEGGAEVAWQVPADGGVPSGALLAALESGYAGYWQALADGAATAQVFEAFGRFRVLCALRAGPWGAESLGAELSLRARSRLDAPSGELPESAWYRGRPVMVLRNDPLLRLFNGDIGIALPARDGELAVHFLAPEGGFRAIAPVRLPPHQTAFAMTVHKSQGSEFDQVALVLPVEPSPVLTRELLYTGLTRARRSVLLLASAERVAQAVAAPTRRDSGLRERLDEALAAGGERAAAGLVPEGEPRDDADPAGAPADFLS